MFAKPIEASNKTASGLFVPDKAIEDLKQAEVVNVGDDVLEYQAHDKILYKEYSTTEVKLDEDKYVMLLEEDILGKLVEVGEVGNDNR